MNSVRIAIRALIKNKMRASLTILGVVIGIAAVTTMVSIGQSASALVAGEFESLGTNVILVFPERSERGGVRQSAVTTLTAEDAEAIARECDSVVAASPLVGASGQLVYGNENFSPNEMHGVGVDYLTVRNWTIAPGGGFFTERDVQTSEKVCVIGHTIVAKLFQTTNPIGETIRIKNIPFRVIGVLEEKGANMVGQDQDNIVLIPYTTVRKRLQGSNFNDVNAIFASAISVDLMSRAEEEIEQLLMERHRLGIGQPADFDVQNTTEIANSVGAIMGIMTLMLVAIAAISLVVGGVGIMNIMLVSVTERTREIGIRMAVGAKSWDILRQFLIESTLLSVFGGIIGFALGAFFSVALTMLINSLSSGKDWPVVISIPAALMAILISGAAGIFFGFYPAFRASRLDPIDALRYE